MKWGVRKKTPRPTSSDFKKTAPLRKKPVTALTNKQLKEVNERMQLETKYKQLNPTSAKRGRMAVAEILGTIGLGVAAYNLFHSPAGKALMSIGKKKAKQLTLPGM